MRASLNCLYSNNLYLPTQVVRESLVCCGIVGHQGIKEHIFSVEVTCQFVTPILSMSSQKLNFYIEKLPGEDLTQLYEELVLKNVSSLSLSMELSLATPFSLCEARGVQSTANIKVCRHLSYFSFFLFNCHPCFHCDILEQRNKITLNICYKGHPQQDKVEMHAEVHYPNLHFSSTTVDFGSVLNSTENHQEVTMTNCSPLPVFYHWACLVDHTHCFNLFYKQYSMKYELNKFIKKKTELNFELVGGDKQLSEHGLYFIFIGIFFSAPKTFQCSLLSVSTLPTQIFRVKNGSVLAPSRYCVLFQAIDKATLSNLLPEQLLVEILTERFQFDDCYCGIIIHGLDSVYTKSVTYSLQVVLKALKNRKHIYVINLVDTYSALKARKRAQKKAEGKLACTTTYSLMRRFNHFQDKQGAIVYNTYDSCQ
uniref:Hydin adenylate kinase-like domain-containing protein n=1 Tax=Hippocampus comes TaxID=109280 RepID=A0A3Q2ZC70_HIPCM